jgi:uncharacterized protein involved in exopolysaccharide biosynthesis
MKDESSRSGASGDSVDEAARERVIYVVQQDAQGAYSEPGIDLVDLWRTIWRGKWLIMGITALFAIVSIAYALLAPQWYRAEVLLVPAEDQAAKGLAAQLGGLASLAGIDMGEGSTAEPIAVLKSREFARAFIEDYGLLTVLLADLWDEEAKRWKASDPKDWPDVRDAVKFFDENVRGVYEDARTGLVTLSVEWKDPSIAAEWANILVKRLNERMRGRALAEAEANVTFLQSEMGSTSIVSLQQSIGRLLEGELQKLMLARGNEEFAFRVIDKAEPPKRRSKPKRALLVILATVLGGVIATLAVVLGSASSKRGNIEQPQSQARDAR